VGSSHITPHHDSQSKSQSYKVGQSVLVSGTHLGPATNFSPSIFDYVLIIAGLLMWGALSDERTDLQCHYTSSISSFIATDGLSASSWFRAQNGAHDQILISLFDNYFPLSRCIWRARLNTSLVICFWHGPHRKRLFHRTPY
jgi:hypothetical protein